VAWAFKKMGSEPCFSLLLSSYVCMTSYTCSDCMMINPLVYNL